MKYRSGPSGHRGTVSSINRKQAILHRPRLCDWIVDAGGRKVAGSRRPIGAEQNIENREIGGVIAVAKSGLQSVMQAMPLRAGHDWSEAAERQSNIGVIEEAPAEEQDERAISRARV